MARDLNEIYFVPRNAGTIKMYPAQTVSDKHRIIERCKQTIAEMRTNIQKEKSKPHDIQNQKYIERCENIIRNQREMIVREEESLAIFKEKSRKLQSKIQEQDKIMKILSNDNQR